MSLPDAKNGLITILDCVTATLCGALLWCVTLQVDVGIITYSGTSAIGVLG